MSDRRLDRINTVFDSYEIDHAIGQGTLGTVYRARQIRLNREVAVKFIDGAFAGSFSEDEFRDEMEGLGKIYHPNVATIIDCGIARGQPFIVVELVNGMNLVEFLQAGRPEPLELMAIISQICDGLSFVHERGVLHLDLTPRHIMLSDLGWVKMVDFRMSRPFTVEGAGNNQGLPFFSPELIHGREVDERSDIYSFGKIIWYLLSGEIPPIHRDGELEIGGLDEDWTALVARAVRSDPDERFAAVGEICQAAAALMGHAESC